MFYASYVTIVQKMTMNVKPKNLADHFLSIGRYAFTLDEAAAALGVDDAAARSALSRLRRRSEIFSPTQGLYVAVPPNYRSWGVLPGEWFIDPMMTFLGRPYYVALLTAASMHGAAHQAPRSFEGDT